MGNKAEKQLPKLEINQRQVLDQAGKIAQQLHLHQSQNQLKDNRHLLARILIYGHGHLITHLKIFNKQKQKQIIRTLKTIDYQTTDLLYQNLILKKINSQRNKIKYEQWSQYHRKIQQKNQNQRNYNICYEKGEEALKNSKVAILLSIGQMSPRFKNQNNQIICKQIYTAQQTQKSLLELALDKISSKIAIYGSILVYIVHNNQNSKKLKQIQKNYSGIRIKNIIQNQNPVVNLSGKLCLKNSESFQILQSSSGCGDFINLHIRGNKLLDDLICEQINYICISGVDNIFAQIGDPYLIGLLEKEEGTSACFKCTYPDNENQNLKRIVRNKTENRLQASQLQSLLQKSDNKSLPTIRRSPVWMNDSIFRISHLQQYQKHKQNKVNGSQVFTTNKLQCTYWNPNTNSYNNQQHCYTFQRDLSDLIFNDQFKSVGVMVEREKQFMPVVTINTWTDAYNQYMEHQEENKILENYDVSNTNYTTNLCGEI